MLTNQDIFRDEWWIDISFQLLCFGLLDASNFDGPLLRSDIPNAIWLRNQLVRTALEPPPFFTGFSNANDGWFVLEPHLSGACSYAEKHHQNHGVKAGFRPESVFHADVGGDGEEE